MLLDDVNRAASAVGAMGRAPVKGLFTLGLLADCAAASAAISDCEGLSRDGQAQCKDPTCSPTEYNLCYIGSSYLYKDNAMTACFTELGLSRPILSEGAVVAWADCFDRKMVPTGGVTGPLSWKSVETAYTSNFCWSGTGRNVNGHQVWGVAEQGGSSHNYEFMRRPLPQLSLLAHDRDSTFQCLSLGRMFPA